MIMTGLKGLLSIIVGLLFWLALVYVLTYPSWLRAFVTLIQGGLVSLIFLIGVGFLLFGVSQMRE